MKPSVASPPLAVVTYPKIAFAQPGAAGFVSLVATDRAAREEILHRAYSIWESEGCPENRDLAHWLQAEAEVLP